jgi:transposase
MMIVPAGVKVHLALGYTDMRKGMDGLAMLVQETLKKDPFCGHLFAFRGKRAQIVKILFWDGMGCACSPSGSIGAGSCGRG